MVEARISRAALLAGLLFALPGGLLAAQVTEIPALNPGVGGNVSAAGASLGTVSAGIGANALNISAPTLNGTLLPSAASPRPALNASAPIGAAVQQEQVAPAAKALSQSAPSAAASAVASPAAAKPAPAAALPSAGAVAQGRSPSAVEPGAVPRSQTAAAPAVGGRQFQEGLRRVGEKTGDIRAGLGAKPGDAPSAGETLSDLGTSVFDGSGRAPAAAAPSAAAGPGLMQTLDAVSRLSPDAAKDPAVFKALSARLLKGLKDPQANPALKAKSAYQTGKVSEIVRAQQSFGLRLKESSEALLRREGVPAGDIITHGTDLQGLLGMLFSGKIDATNPYQGFSGERAEVWGAKGLGAGAEYGAKRGVAKGRPGVSILIHNPSDPIAVKGGETLSRAPAAEKDFLAAVITDGLSTVVLDRAALQALAASARTWKESAVSEARRGRMREFSEWERLRDFLEPKAR